MARLQEQVGGREGIGRQNGPDKIFVGVRKERVEVCLEGIREGGHAGHAGRVGIYTSAKNYAEDAGCASGWSGKGTVWWCDGR